MLKTDCRRSTIEVLADILRLGEARKAEIIYATHTSHRQLQKHLNLMLELKLVDMVTVGSSLVTYRATQKGLKLLRQIDTVLEILAAKEPIDL